MEKEIVMDCSECEHLETTYYEYDTGYREYECGLFGDCVYDGCCPLNCKYVIEEE